MTRGKIQRCCLQGKRKKEQSDPSNQPSLSQVYSVSKAGGYLPTYLPTYLFFAHLCV